MNKEKKVIVYSTDWCPYCKHAKNYLKNKGVDFKEKNIEEDGSAREELMEKTNGIYSGVPVIDINGELLQGFDQNQIDLALEA